MARYSAPWSLTLKIVSGLVTVICLGLALGLVPNAKIPHFEIFERSFRIFAAAGLFLAALFTIRGYSLTGDTLLVHRLFWSTTVPLSDLQSAEFLPGVMRYSLRLCGNGGVFSFTGYYRNKELGVYRAFVTDLNRTVVLRFPKRTVVVSPGAPRDFAAEVAAHAQS